MRYEVVQKVSEGRFGKVSKGKELQSGREVAIKEFKAGGMRSKHDGPTTTSSAKIEQFFYNCFRNLLPTTDFDCEKGSKEFVYQQKLTAALKQLKPAEVIPSSECFEASQDSSELCLVTDFMNGDTPTEEQTAETIWFMTLAGFVIGDPKLNNFKQALMGEVALPIDFGQLVPMELLNNPEENELFSQFTQCFLDKEEPSEIETEKARRAAKDYLEGIRAAIADAPANRAYARVLTMAGRGAISVIDQYREYQKTDSEAGSRPASDPYLTTTRLSGGRSSGSSLPPFSIGSPTSPPEGLAARRRLGPSSSQQVSPQPENCPPPTLMQVQALRIQGEDQKKEQCAGGNK